MLICGICIAPQSLPDVYPAPVNLKPQAELTLSFQTATPTLA